MSNYVKIDDEFGTGAVIVRKEEQNQKTGDVRFFEGKSFANLPIGVLENFDLWNAGKPIETEFVAVGTNKDGTCSICVYSGKIPGSNLPYIVGSLMAVEEGDENDTRMWPQYWGKMYDLRIMNEDTEENYTLYMTHKGLLTLLAQRGEGWRGES